MFLVVKFESMVVDGVVWGSEARELVARSHRRYAAADARESLAVESSLSLVLFRRLCLRLVEICFSASYCRCSTLISISIGTAT